MSTFCPFLVAKGGANCADECAIGEGVKSASIGAEQQAIEAIFKLFWTEEVLFDSVHPVPFVKNTSNTLVYSIVNPVFLVLLFFNSAEAKTVDCVFGFQTNHIVGEETKVLQFA